MYSYIEGIVTNKFLSSICITINGLGYEVFVLDVDKYKLNDTCKLFLYDYIKENVEIIIFGFQDFEQLTMFKKLLLVNGIGPKSALAILKHNNVNVLVSLIKEGDATTLNNLKGIQNRGQSIILELKNKLKEFDFDLLRYVNVIRILKNLGYNDDEIGKAIAFLPDNLTDGEALKQSLRLITNERNK